MESCCWCWGIIKRRPGSDERYIGAKCLNQVNTGGENISLTYSPDGNYVAVGTKVG